jgi:Tannase and feruloyl esterase.
MQPTQGIRIQPSQEEKGETSSAEDAPVQFHGIQKPSVPVADKAAKVLYTRPVFPYPYIIEYKGKGDIRDPDNYHAVKSDAYDRMHLNSPISDMLSQDDQKN